MREAIDVQAVAVHAEEEEAVVACHFKSRLREFGLVDYPAMHPSALRDAHGRG